MWTNWLRVLSTSVVAEGRRWAASASPESVCEANSQ